MHVLLVRVLQGAALAVALLVAKVLQFLFKCCRAHRQFKACKIPGPPTDNVILGKACAAASPSLQTSNNWLASVPASGCHLASQASPVAQPCYRLQQLKQRSWKF
jgi:hypothetical protein